MMSVNFKLILLKSKISNKTTKSISSTSNDAKTVLDVNSNKISKKKLSSQKNFLPKFFVFNSDKKKIIKSKYTKYTKYQSVIPFKFFKDFKSRKSLKTSNKNILKHFYQLAFIPLNLLNIELFFKNKQFSSVYAFQGRVSYLPLLNCLSYRFFFAIANQWLNLRELFLIYEFLFFFKITNSYRKFLSNPVSLNFFASILLYEKLTYFLLLPQLFKSFFNFSECLLKIRLTTSNFFFTALDAVSYKTLITGTGGMLHIPLIKYSNKLNIVNKISKKKFVQRQDIRHKRTVQQNSAKAIPSRSKKFSKKQVQASLNKKKRPKWIQKTSFTSLFYLCDKFFNALKDFGYLQLRFWLLGHKVYNVFFKKKIIPRWKKQYSKILFLSPYVVFQAMRSHNGMRLKKTRRV